MNTTTETPNRPGMRPEEIDPETERVILERLATFDDDAKTAVDAREALVGIRRKLKHASTR